MQVKDFTVAAPVTRSKAFAEELKKLSYKASFETAMELVAVTVQAIHQKIGVEAVAEVTDCGLEGSVARV
jgi:hypothetical protein